MINPHLLTWSKVDKFFDEEGAQSSLKYAALCLNKAITDIQHDLSEKFADYLRDEFRLMFDDIIRREVIRVVSDMMKGDVNSLEEFNLAPADWGLKGDHLGIRRKIIEDNADIIRNTHIRGLEEELERARDIIKRYQEYR